MKRFGAALLAWMAIVSAAPSLALAEEPSLSLQRACATSFGGPTTLGLTISASGLPPNQPLVVRASLPTAGEPFTPELQVVADAEGNFSFGPFGLSFLVPGVASVTITYGEVTLSESVEIGCQPADKEDCKNGGWRTFDIFDFSVPGSPTRIQVFKNQGDCVSFVASGGKNTPGGH